MAKINLYPGVDLVTFIYNKVSVINLLIDEYDPKLCDFIQIYSGDLPNRNKLRLGELLSTARFVIKITGCPMIVYVRSKKPVLASKHIVTQLHIPFVFESLLTDYEDTYNFRNHGSNSAAYELEAKLERKVSKFDPILPPYQSKLVIDATHPKSLLSTLREEIAKMHEPIELTRTIALHRLKQFYNSFPAVVRYFKLCDSKKLQPLTLDNAIDSGFSQQFEEFSTQSPEFSKIHIRITGPPIAVEEQVDLARTIELTIMPAFLTMRFKIDREPGEDQLFNKLASALPECVEGNCICAQYESFLKLGAMFTLGEENELEVRLHVAE